ncbi:MAG: hypothetical protein KAX49_19415, partial [Halanaerobiales bacterium]|nr:hypothetical protein [Halanaerobiales bacterium]
MLGLISLACPYLHVKLYFKLILHNWNCSCAKKFIVQRLPTLNSEEAYITLKAIDAAGNIATATTNRIKIDSSLPPVPDVNTDGVYVSENDKIHFTIDMDNPEQEVIGYRYRIVDDFNNMILNWQEIVISELKQDIIEDGDGSYTDSGWANVTIDSVAPQITELNHPNYASEDCLTISWLAVEDYSELTYKVKIGSASGEGDILSWRSLGRNTQHTFDELQIDDGEIVYITLYAEDGSGLSTTDISGPVIIDNTAPPIPVVIDGGLYTNDDTQLSVSWTWTQTDPESGIDKYEIALLTSKEVHGNIDWIPVNAEVTEYTFYDTLQHNTVYFVAVKSINRAGKFSIGFSDGILVDTTKPNPPSIDDFLDYTATQNSLIAQLSGAYDPESGIASFYYSLGTLDNLTLLIDNKEVTGTTVVGEEFSTEIDNNGQSLVIGNIYFFEGVAKNGAGDISASTMSDGIMVLDGTQPKVNKITDGGVYSIDNQTLSFVWEINKSKIPLKHYQYALVNDIDGTILDSDWKTSDERRVDITKGDGEYFIDGATYYLAVRVVNQLNWATAKLYSDGIVVDASGPRAPVLNLEDYVSKDFLLKWTANDPHSGIKSYQYAVGTTRGGTDVTNGWQSLDLLSLSENESTQQINRHLSLNLTHGERYYLSVKAENGVGLWSSSAMSRALIADLEPPTIPNVTALNYTNDDSQILDISFNSNDSDSGIIAYRYQVVDNTELTGDLSTPINNLDAVTHDYNNTNLDITGLALDEDIVYYIAIQTRDVAGNWSDIGYSNPITVDITVPTLTFNDQSAEIVTNDGTKKVYFTTNEPGTLFYRVVWLNADGTVAYAP